MFFKISETGDLRFLLITKNYPENVPDDLLGIWENIKKEWEHHSGNNETSSNVADLDETAREMNEINRLKAIYSLMRLGDVQMIKELEELGIYIENISPESLSKVWGMIQIQQTNLEIYVLRYNSKTKLKDNGEKFNFLQALNQLSNFFGRTIPREITTTEWAYLMRDVAKIKAQKKNGTTRKP